MKCIEIKDVLVRKNTVNISFEVGEDLKKYFKDNKLTITYTVNESDLNLENVPISILVVPLICNILPIIWITDGILYIDEIDEDFYKSINEFKKGYIEMYPQIYFLGDIKVKKIIKYEPITKGRSATFFSGGVDAYCTLARHIDENPDLLSIWGSDIPYDDKNGWKTLQANLFDEAKKLELDFIIIHSSFRKMLDESVLDKDFKLILKDNWWHGIQHGIGLIGHAAPCNFLRGVTTQYIAASFWPDINITCASWPSIDNFVKYCGCQTIHDAFISRQEKIKIIIEKHYEKNLPINLHVCWQTTTGKNCCKCEKCCRTIMELIVEGEDPNSYGFSVNSKILFWCKWRSILKFDYDFVTIPYWNAIKNRFIMNKQILRNKNNYRYINWIEDFDFENPDKNMYRRIYRVLRKIKRKIFN